MFSNPGFQEYYKDKILPEVEVLEQYRSKNAARFRLYFTLAIICMPLIVLGFATDNPFAVLFGILPTFIFLGMTLQTYNNMNKTLRYPFKYKVLLKAIDFLFDEYEYIPYQRIAKSVLTKSSLFPRDIGIVKGEDLMKYKIGDTIIMFCETKVLGLHGKEMFRGIFISSSFNKNFRTETFVISRKVSGFMLKLKRRVFNHLHTIDLENSAFEKSFYIIGADQVESRYILTPSLMKRILDYKQKTGKAISIAFIKNRLYCTVPKFFNLFEVPFLKPINLEVVKKTLEPVILYTDIVEDLNLNVRIWSKQ